MKNSVSDSERLKNFFRNRKSENLVFAVFEIFETCVENFLGWGSFLDFLKNLKNGMRFYVLNRVNLRNLAIFSYGKAKKRVTLPECFLKR